MRRVRTLVLLLLVAGGVSAQEVSRADLGLAYLRVDRAYREHPPADPREANDVLDYVVRDFLRGRFEEVLERLDDATAKLRPDGAHPPGVRVRVEPRVSPPGVPTRARITALYPDARTWTLRVRGEKGVVWHATVNPPADVDLPRNLPEGAYVLDLVQADGPAWEMDHWYVSVLDLGAIRARNAARLAKVEAPAYAVAACRARNDLVRVGRSETSSVRFLADPVTLAREVTAEVFWLEAFGASPYRQLCGDYWRTVPANGTRIPMRVYAPAAARGRDPLPLVIALHGAGGDETMFFRGYGAGRIKELADEHGFVVVTPTTYLAANPKFLDAILDAIGRDYRIDRRRVYVLGHSLGAMAAARLAERPEIAAAACLAGGVVASDKAAPTLVWAAERDPIIPAARLREGYERARHAGARVEFRVAPGLGHTFLVTAVLPDAVAWLLQHEREAP
jgi:dienelactone hydrolase